MLVTLIAQALRGIGRRPKSIKADHVQCHGDDVKCLRLLGVLLITHDGSVAFFATSCQGSAPWVTALAPS